jgi:hypothetical protein
VMRRRPSCSTWIPATCCPETCTRSTTAEAETKRRYGSLRKERSSSRMRSAHLKATYASGRRHGMKNASSRRYARLLHLDFDRVIVSHGEPLHTRAEFEAALMRPPFSP